VTITVDPILIAKGGATGGRDSETSSATSSKTSTPNPSPTVAAVVPMQYTSIMQASKEKEAEILDKVIVPFRKF
jgi:hypothetical protein